MTGPDEEQRKVGAVLGRVGDQTHRRIHRVTGFPDDRPRQDILCEGDRSELTRPKFTPPVRPVLPLTWSFISATGESYDYV